MGKVLVIRPLGGLCNRMRAMASARLLAGWQERELRVLWRVNHELGASFERLFEPPDSVSVISIPDQGMGGFPLRLRHGYAGIPRSPFLRLGVRILRRMQFDCVLEAGECRRRVEANVGYRDLRDYGQVLLVCYDWICNGHFDFSFLRPQEAIRRRIDGIASVFGPRTVGVHIRRTDHDRAIRNSPLEGFVTKMEAEREADPHTRFYVATDDPETDRALRDRFGSAILPSSRVYGREDVAGIESAVVDLYALARTCRIIGSCESSFSETASRLGGIPLVVVGKGILH